VAGLGAAPNEQLDFLELLKTTPADELLGRLASLTKQERTILDHIVRGHCNKDICRALDIEITTAKVHASRIFRKLGVKNRVQAAVLQLWALLLLDDGLPSRPNAAPRTRAATSHEKSPSASSPLLQCETQT
jgi:DNA-binding CsgD family transcriptional regulator